MRSVPSSRDKYDSVQFQVAQAIIHTDPVYHRAVRCAPDDHARLFDEHASDLLGAHAALLACVDRVAWCGYSYSSAIMARTSVLPTISLHAQCLIAPPNQFDFGTRINWFAHPTTIVVIGAKDTFCDANELKVGGTGEVHVVSGADHFWRGDESKMCDIVIRIFDEHFVSKI